jgi:GNAT superfamily N-acetyltransferase
MPGDDSVLVRVATPADAESLARLRHAWWVQDHGEGGLDEESFLPAFASWMQERSTTHIPFVVDRDGQPIGMAWLVLVDGIPWPHRFIRCSAHVKSVFVVASERSSGVGTILMGYVVAHARQLGLDYLVVHPSERSFDFYRRLGFAGSDKLLELRD